jgi:hypothetical protein
MFTDSTGRLQPGWAFLFAVVLSALAFLVSGNIANEMVGYHPFVIQLIFRPLWALLLVAIYVWLLTVGDHMEEHRLAAQGLPRAAGWLGQFVLGCVIGGVLTGLAVLPIQHWGKLKTTNLFSLHMAPKIVAVMVMLLCGALAEELMFRGYPFQQLERGIGAIRAVIVFSVIYGVLHLLNPAAGRWGIANTILIGILLSVAYLRTRALWLPWGIHFGWNTTLGFLFGLPVSGFRFFNVVRHTDATGPTWLTGGSYGVEASATGTVVIALGLLLVSVLPLKKLPQPVPTPSPDPALHDSLTGIKP